MECSSGKEGTSWEYLYPYGTGAVHAKKVCREYFTLKWAEAKRFVMMLRKRSKKEYKVSGSRKSPFMEILDHARKK